jgi:hypothetical protein
MVALVYGVSAYERQRGDLPELPVVNMFSEFAVSEGMTTLQSRPGLETSTITMGEGPVTRLYKIDGVLEGLLFGVSGNEFYVEEELLGSLTGTGPSSITGYEDRVFVNSGGPIYSYNGTVFSTVAFPDDADVSKVLVGASRLVAIKADTGRFYWSDVLTSAIDDLSFATAENSPDKLKDALYVGDTLILFGAETVEFWAVSSDPDLPFQPTPGRTYQTGIKARGCATEYLDAWAWVTDKNQVCINTPTDIVSYPGLETKIENSTNRSLWTFSIDGVEFLVLRLDDETWAYHSRHSTWSQLESYGENNWLPQCFEEGYFGLSNSGELSQWSDNYYDYGSVLERRFRAGLSIEGGTQQLGNILIRTNPGHTDILSGDYSNPYISLRLSKDGGFEWSNWKEARLGTQGSYGLRTVWTSLGYFQYPGIIVEFRVTDPVPFRVSGVFANEPYGGI